MDRVEPGTTSEAPPKEVERRLWFGLLAAPAAWTISEIVAVSVLGRSCDSGPTLSAWQWVTLLGVSAAAIVVAAAAAVVSYRTFKARTRGGKVTAAEGWDRVEFMAQLGFFLSLLLLLNIVFFGLTPLLVDPCLHTAA